MMKMMQILSVSVSGLAALIVAAPEVSANLNKQAVFIDDGSDELSIYTHTHDSFRQTHLVSEPSPLFLFYHNKLNPSNAIPLPQSLWR